MESQFNGVIAKYHETKFLSSMGYTFDPTALTDFEVSCLRIVHHESMKLKQTSNQGADNGE